MSHKPSLSLLLTGLYSPVVSRILCCGCSFPLAWVNKIVMRLGLNLQHAKELHQTASCVTFSFRIYRDSITEQYMKINIISQNLIGTYMKTNWPNRCLLFVSSKFLQGIESLRIKTKSFKSCWGLWVSTICCRAGAARGQKFLKELRNFQKSFDNFRNELKVQLHCKQSKPETLFTKMMLLEKAKNWQLFSVSLLHFFVWSVWVAASR